MTPSDGEIYAAYQTKCTYDGCTWKATATDAAWMTGVAAADVMPAVMRVNAMSEGAVRINITPDRWNALAAAGADMPAIDAAIEGWAAQ